MKKVLAVAVLTLATLPAMAQWHHHGHHGYRGGHGGGWNWVFPAIIGGAVVYGATRPDVIVQQPPVVIQPQIPQGVQVIQCPAGTMPFEQYGWVRNQYGQYVQTTYVECK
jgi:hypothetical protein